MAQQLGEIVLPDGRHGMSAVAARPIAKWDHDGFAALHADDLSLENAEFGGIDEIVGRVNGQQLCFDLFEIGAGIIIARGIERVEGVVGVHVDESVAGAGGEASVAYQEGLVGAQRRWAQLDGAAGNLAVIQGEDVVPVSMFI